MKDISAAPTGSCGKNERFADIELLRYRLPAFPTLPLREKQLVRCLAEATLWGRDITCDQFGRYNLRIRRLTEAVWLHYRERETGEEFDKLYTYLKRIWFANGIYHHYSCRKMLPECGEEYFKRLVLQMPATLLPLGDGESVGDMLGELLPVMFSPEVLPQRVCHDTGRDIVVASACNFYDGVTEREATAYYEALRREHTANTGVADEQPSWGLNTRLAKLGGRLREETWRIGGMYSPYLERIDFWLGEALRYADDEGQREVIALLREYYRTGSLATFDRYSIAWVAQTRPRVDFINGFIEVYGDPLGLKGSWEGIVHYRDLEATRRTETLCRRAQWFEDNSPVDARFKKREVRGVTANVVCAAMLGGDEYPASAIGINLPNADWIRARHGSKSVTISNLTAAYDEASRASGFRQEFIDDEAVLALVGRYAALTDDLHTDLHECLGHGSGQLLPGVAADALRAYASTIEEARADLFGLYYIADSELVRLGLLPDGEAFRAQYYTYMLNGLLTQCVRIPFGEDIEEAHMRNRALIAHWCLSHGGDTLRLVSVSGKTFLRITDYKRLRQLIGQLLAEVQRIKSEGDIDAARTLVEDYGVRINPTLHREMLDRYSHLDIAPYKGFVNPIYREVRDSDGRVVDVVADETETYTAQMLRYSRDYSL